MHAENSLCGLYYWLVVIYGLKLRKLQVVNDVIYVRRRRCHSNRVKVAVPMVTSSTGKYRKDWLMTSSEHVQRGDIVVEVCEKFYKHLFDEATKC